MREIPIYLFSGFLEAGKTTMIAQALADPGFSAGEKTLLLLCEEGIEEYDPSEFASENTWVEGIDSVEDLTPQTLRSGLNWGGYLPGFAVKQVDLAGTYRERCRDIGKYGYGVYAKYHMFYIGPDNRIIPVQNPDQTRLSSLIDYKREQQIIVDNTLALLSGKPAANILLTGDAGTGKSSTVKAVVNELHHKGLRILEVRKEQLHAIPAILDALKAVSIPAVEVHISDVDARESFRQISYAGLACVKTIKGQGLDGYRQAIQYLKEHYG